MADHMNAPGPNLSDRLCPVCGGRNAYFGFGPPGADVGVRWYCGRHKDYGKDWWGGVRGESKGPKPEALF